MKNKKLIEKINNVANNITKISYNYGNFIIVNKQISELIEKTTKQEKRKRKLIKILKK